MEVVGDTGPTDGMIFDAAGNLYFTSIELNAVTRLTRDGQLQLVVRDQQLKWPDSFSVGPDGGLYVTTSQLHIPRSQRTEPFQIFKLTLPQ